MNDQFNIEAQYQFYLKCVHMSEDNMLDMQKQQLRDTFYAACGQLIIFFRDDFSNMEESKGVDAIENIFTQVGDHFRKYLKQ